MEYIKLNNGIEMPKLGYGTFRLKDEECADAVAGAIECGYRLIDTAEAYGNEAAVGEGIRKSSIDRDELFIVTKINFTSFEHPEASIKNSFKFLGTDHIDLMLIHWPFGNYYAAWRVMEKYYEDGSIRALGVSNFEPSQLVDLIGYNKVAPVVDQVDTNLYCQKRHERSWMDRKNVAHMAYAPLGQGRNNAMFDEPVLKDIAQKYGKTPVQTALRYLTQKDIIVIPMSRSKEHIMQNIDVFDFSLTEEEMAALEQLDKGEKYARHSNDPERVEWSLTI